jgi:TorA maturation chaperone TorD
MNDSWDEIWNLRASLYGFFGDSLLEPMQGQHTVTFSKEFWRDFPLEAANAQMKAGLEQLINCSTFLDGFSDEEATENIMVEYTSLFLGPGLPKAPPCESFYRTPERLFFGGTAYEMKAALNASGLESIRKDNQPEDHIGLELMFLSALSNKLPSFEKSQQVSAMKEQASFIDHHLLSWIPELCQDAKLNGSVGFYGGLLELIWGILLWDRELIDEFVVGSDQEAVTMTCL